MRSEIRKEREAPLQWNLADTITNGIHVQFKQISRITFDSLSKQKRDTEIPLISFEDYITKLGDCQTFKLHNGNIDSLCNLKDGDYYEQYEIHGLWQSKDKLLISFQNWEEGHYILVNLTDGRYYTLGPSYKVSPNLEMILSYNSGNNNPIYSDALVLTKVDKGTPKTLVKNLDQLPIIDCFWVSDSDCVVTTEKVDEDTGDIIKREFFLLKTR